MLPGLLGERRGEPGADGSAALGPLAVLVNDQGVLCEGRRGAPPRRLALNAFVNAATRPAIAFSSSPSLAAAAAAEAGVSFRADSCASRPRQVPSKSTPSNRQTGLIPVTPLRSRSEASASLSWSVERDWFGIVEMRESEARWRGRRGEPFHGSTGRALKSDRS